MAARLAAAAALVGDVAAAAVAVLASPAGEGCKANSVPPWGGRRSEPFPGRLPLES